MTTFSKICIATLLTCVWLVVASGCNSPLVQDIKGEQPAMTQIELDALIATAVGEAMAKIKPTPAPDEPDPKPGPKVCFFCKGSGCVGDGRVFYKCQSCDTPCSRSTSPEDFYAAVKELTAELDEYKAYRDSTESFLKEQGFRPDDATEMAEQESGVIEQDTFFGRGRRTRYRTQ